MSLQAVVWRSLLPCCVPLFVACSLGLVSWSVIVCLLGVPFSVLFLFVFWCGDHCINGTKTKRSLFEE